MGPDTAVCIIRVEVSGSYVGSFIEEFSEIEERINGQAYVTSAVLTVPPTVALKVVIGRPE